MKSAKWEDQVLNEIKAHGETWCNKDCQTFSMTAYRLMRLEGLTAKNVQADYDLSHAVR